MYLMYPHKVAHTFIHAPTLERLCSDDVINGIKAYIALKSLSPQTYSGMDKVVLAVLMLCCMDYGVNPGTYKMLKHDDVKQVWHLIERIALDGGEISEIVSSCIHIRDAAGYYTMVERRTRKSLTPIAPTEDDDQMGRLVESYILYDSPEALTLASFNAMLDSRRKYGPTTTET